MPIEILKDKKILIVVPARYSSERLPGKVMMKINDTPMFACVYNEISKIENVDCVVAVEHDLVEQECISRNIPFIRTATHHTTPTSRIAEVSDRIEAELYIFIGADEIFMTQKMVENFLLDCLKNKDDITVFNGYREIEDLAELQSVNIIKVVTGNNKRIIYTSRNAVPGALSGEGMKCKKFIGISAFQKSALSDYAKRLPSMLEQTEKCDLLRFIEYGETVQGIEVSGSSFSIDVIEDWEKSKKILEGWI